MVAMAVAVEWHEQASEVAIAGLYCGGEELWWPQWHVAAAIDRPGVSDSLGIEGESVERLCIWRYEMIQVCGLQPGGWEGLVKIETPTEEAS